LGLSGAVPTNADVMLVLLDIDTGTAGPNPHHSKNPQQLKFFDPKLVSSLGLPGLSTVDYQFRDPWGNPYVITLDMNYDGKCDDALYKLKSVSYWQGNGGTGYNGLTDTTDPTGATGPFELSGSVMIWSMGPDGKCDQVPANSGVNKDNVLGWQ
jgi:hypothetical protein